MKKLAKKTNSKEIINEVIKTIRNNLKFYSKNNENKTILITSPNAKEGKSFISANLAIEYANYNKKVLLVDCDLRKGCQHEIFDIITNSKIGLTNLLIDDNWKKNIGEYIFKANYNNLSILPVGTIPNNPSVLLETLKFEKVIEELKSNYDIIIFDSTYINGLVDTLIISRLTDIVLLVVKTKKTTMEQLESAKKSLEKVGANIGGVILNKVDL